MIFTSVNTIKIFFNKLANLNISISSKNLKFAVIGSKVKEELKKQSFETSFIPSKYISETFINEFEKLDLTNSKILLPCSEIARDLIYDSFLEKHVDITKLNIYTTIKPEVDNIQKIVDLITRDELAYITFTSPSTVSNFFEILQGYKIKELIYKTKSKVICIGPTTANKFESIFDKKPLIPNKFTIDGVLDIINFY